MAYTIYCDIDDEVYGYESNWNEEETVDTEEEAEIAMRRHIEETASALQNEGLFITFKDVYLHEVCATDGHGNYVSYGFYRRRANNHT